MFVTVFGVALFFDILRVLNARFKGIRKMYIWSRIIVFSFAALLAGCGASKPATPVETFKTYAKATAKKDIPAMRLLLSEATLKMHEKEAIAQGVTVNDIIGRQTLFAENQRAVEFKDEKIDGDKATLQLKNATSKKWQTIFFVRENGEWKIDVQSSADQFAKDIEEEQRQKFDQLSNFNASPQATEPIQEP